MSFFFFFKSLFDDNVIYLFVTKVMNFLFSFFLMDKI